MSGRQFALVAEGKKDLRSGGPARNSSGPRPAPAATDRALPGVKIIDISIEHEDDCAHFVSRCLGALSGGLPIPNRVGMAKGFLSAPDLVKYLIGSGIAKAVVEKSDKAEAFKYVGTLMPDDVIGYFPRHGKDYGHSALHIGSGRIACHSISRWG